MGFGCSNNLYHINGLFIHLITVIYIYIYQRDSDGDISLEWGILMEYYWEWHISLRTVIKHGQPRKWMFNHHRIGISWAILGIYWEYNGTITGYVCVCMYIYYPLVNQHNYGKSPCYSWLSPLFRLGHFPVRKLLVYQKVDHPNFIFLITPIYYGK